MKRFRFAGLLAAVIIMAVTVPCYPASYGKNLYRSFSARLGKKRSDYPGLNDAEFANFREINTSGIAPGKLFRSSSPISTWGSRNEIADTLARSAGIMTFINLADPDKGMSEHKGYTGSYYSTRKVTGLNLRMKYKSDTFRRKLAGGIRFMAANEPPYLIHCSLGKDRAGFVCAVIECLMGASWPEVERDYMISFRNYFGVEHGTREYDFVVENEIRRFIAENFGVNNPETARLSEAAERYLLMIGVPSDDIGTLRRKLGGVK